MTIKPELAAEWHPTKNGDLRPDDACLKASTVVWWRCSTCGYEWETKISNRNRGTGCPCCSGKKTIAGKNDLATANPTLAAQWHPTKNGGISPTEVAPYSKKRGWWLCPDCGHEWETVISSRQKGSGCPRCAARKQSKDAGTLAESHPKLAATWHPTKNGDLKPTQVTKSMPNKVWWRCSDCGREWQETIKTRDQDAACPICAIRRQLRSKESFAVSYPELAAEWHPTKNGDLKPTDVTRFSSEKVWWTCSKCGHEWQVMVISRSFGFGCTKCIMKKFK